MFFLGQWNNSIKNNVTRSVLAPQNQIFSCLLLVRTLLWFPRAPTKGLWCFFAHEPAPRGVTFIIPLTHPQFASLSNTFSYSLHFFMVKYNMIFYCLTYNNKSVILRFFTATIPSTFICSVYYIEYFSIQMELLTCHVLLFKTNTPDPSSKNYF